MKRGEGQSRAANSSWWRSCSSRRSRRSWCSGAPGEERGPARHRLREARRAAEWLGGPDARASTAAWHGAPLAILALVLAGFLSATPIEAAHAEGHDRPEQAQPHLGEEDLRPARLHAHGLGLLKILLIASVVAAVTRSLPEFSMAGTDAKFTVASSGASCAGRRLRRAGDPRSLVDSSTSASSTPRT